MTKISLLKDQLNQSLTKLEIALKQPETELIRDATIQRFEFCFELSWKLLSALLQDQNAAVYGTKNIIRQATQIGLIDNPETWFEYLEARNLTVHTYNENIAKIVYQKTKTFPPLVHKLLDDL